MHLILYIVYDAYDAYDAYDLLYTICSAFNFPRLQVIVNSLWKKVQIFTVEKETPRFLFPYEKRLFFYRFSLL